MKKKIVIESMYLYNYNTPEMGVTVGGSQRYTLDLGRLFYRLGYEVIFITKAKINSNSDFEGWATIIAFNSPYGEKGNINFSKRVYKYCKSIKPKLVCYSDMQIGFPYCYENSFSLQHGIAWDNPNQKIKNLVKSYFYLKAMKKFRRVVCVDTNFINWCREKSKYYFNNPEKLVYIPNYADEKQFSYRYSDWNHESKFKLLYPRRLVAHRGFNIFMEMCKVLLEKGYDIEPILAFEDFRGKDFRKMYPEYSKMKCNIVHPGMEDIDTYYRDAYLAFIPTIWSEGTSLSAIESISTGCPVIVSDVGGLGNIVLPDFNGYIVPPTVNEFINITEELLNNVEKRNQLSHNCRSMNQIFGKKRWEDKIIDTIQFLL